MNVPRKDISPVWTRSFPVSKEPQTLGEQLRKRRFGLGIRQSEAAQKLGISKRTLSLWEGNHIHPAWSRQPRVIAYLGYDPFTTPALGRPQGNETPGVAFLVFAEPLSFGQQITKLRLELKKNRKECAQELGISVKTLWGWERDRCQPSGPFRERIMAVLGLDLELTRPTGDN